MKVLLCGAYGKLGTDILKELVNKGHEVLAADMVTREIEGYEGKYEKAVIDVTKPDTLRNICEGKDAVITTVGLTTSSETVTAYDIDYMGNLNLLNAAKKAGVKHFAYVSVFKADNPKAASVPMLDAKAKMEKELKNSGLSYTIYRPTGYFYDIVKVFKPMVEKGKVTLLGKGDITCNVIDTPDLAEFIVSHMCDENKTFNIGGKETYTYQEIAEMMFRANNKEPEISHAPAVLFDILAFVAKMKKNGREGVIRFSKWTLTESMEADIHYGKGSFKQYIEDHGRTGA